MYIVCRRLYEKGVQIPVCLWATHRGLWKDREKPATAVRTPGSGTGRAGFRSSVRERGDRSRAQPGRATVRRIGGRFS